MFHPVIVEVIWRRINLIDRQINQQIVRGGRNFDCGICKDKTFWGPTCGVLIRNGIVQVLSRGVAVLFQWGVTLMSFFSLCREVVFRAVYSGREGLYS